MNKKRKISVDNSYNGNFLLSWNGEIGSVGGLFQDISALEVGGAGVAFCALGNVALRDGGRAFAYGAFDGLFGPVEFCPVGDGGAFQQLVAGNARFGRFAIGDFDTCDGVGGFLAG